MNLTWHIVRKDLRRLWPWLALLTGAILLRYVSAIYFTSLPVRASDVGARWDLREIADWTLLAISLFSTAISAATLVHADPVTGTNAFWITRPLSASRLLLAKITTIFALILLPLVLQLAWWRFHSYSTAEILAQLPTTLARNASTAAGAFFFALLTRNIGHFILSALLGTLAFGAMIAALAKFSPQSWIVHTKTWPLLTLLIVIIGVIAALLAQYLTRRTRLTIGIIVSIFLLSFAVAALWRWPLVKPGSHLADIPALTPPPEIELRCNTITRDSRQAQPASHHRKGSNTLLAYLDIENLPADTAIEFLQPRLNQSRLTARFQSPQLFLESALAAPSTPPAGTVRITSANSSRPVIKPGQTITIPMLLRRLQIVARMPLEAGARARTGAFFTHVIGLTDEAKWVRLAPDSFVRAGGFASLSILVAETCPSHLIDPTTGRTEQYHYSHRHFSFAPREAYILMRDGKVVSSLNRFKGGLRGNSISTDGVQYDRLTLRFPDVVITEADLPRYELLRIVAPAIGTFERTVARPAFPNL